MNNEQMKEGLKNDVAFTRKFLNQLTTFPDAEQRKFDYLKICAKDLLFLRYLLDENDIPSEEWVEKYREWRNVLK